MTNRIEEIRKAQGLRQRDLAQRADVDPGHLSKIETGKTDPRMKTAKRIAAALGESVDDVFDGAGS